MALPVTNNTAVLLIVTERCCIQYISSDGLMSGRELDDVEMHVTRIKPEGLDVLCRDTKFTRKELQIMYRGFKQVRLLRFSVKD